jgi:pimeloyl-ACP methyl ester carboxylesterase
MGTVIRSLLALSVGTTVALASTASERGPVPIDYSRPGILVEVEPGRKLNLRCFGDGPVTILLESGLGYPSYSWRKVQPQLSLQTRTCSYDRAGLGFSDVGPMPRTVSAMAEDIAKLVQAGAIKPPFILVGSSLGGQVVRLYAFRHPGDIAGLVLVDPYVEGQYPAFAAIAPSIAQDVRDLAVEELRCVEQLRAGMSSPDAEREACVASPPAEFSDAEKRVVRAQRLAPKDYETVYSESLMLDSENERRLLNERRDLSPVPIIVLSATKEFESKGLATKRDELLAEKLRLHQSLADLSSGGTVRVVQAGHVIQSDKPDSVIAAVQDILSASGQ